MTGRIALSHVTRYRYDRAVRLGPHVIRLKPAPQARASVGAYRLDILPVDRVLTWHTDAFGNAFARAVFAGPTDRLEVTVAMDLELRPVNPFEFLVEPSAEHVPFDYRPALRHDLGPFLAPAPGGKRFEAMARELGRSRKPSVEFLGDLAVRVADRVAYAPREEEGTQTAEETLARAEGSCRDSAWLMVELLRRNGIAARFVSGYLIELASGVAGTPARDRAELHAWCEAFLPGAGWIGVDGTSGLFATEGHVPLTTSSFPAGAASIEGTVEPCATTFSHAIETARRG